MQTLTKFDTGEVLEPHVHRDGSGNVDFENDESATELILMAKPYDEGDLDDTNVVEIQSMGMARIAVQVESGPLVVFDDAGTPTSLWGPALADTIPASERAVTRGAAVAALYGNDETAVQDAISDLMHFAVSRGMDLDQAMWAATFSYQDDVRAPMGSSS
ncbi:MAG: hypothetical protein ABWX92_02865 [Mycetocola sp.]